jgi:hypothetical protein
MSIMNHIFQVDMIGYVITCIFYHIAGAIDIDNIDNSIMYFHTNFVTIRNDIGSVFIPLMDLGLDTF